MKKHFKKLIIGAAFVGLNTYLSGQSTMKYDCGSDAIIEQYPVLKEIIFQSDEKIKKYQIASYKTSTAATIKVYMHVLYNNILPGTNVSNIKINNQIQALNNAFNGLDVGGYNLQFTWNTSDIERVSIGSKTYTWETDEQLKEAYPAYDPVHYLNIWVCDLTNYSDGSSPTGYAYFPAAIAPPIGMGTIPAKRDGIVIDYKVFGNNSSAGFTSGNLAVHEVGHYFNLYHIWGNSNTGFGACNPDDEVFDTPNTCNPIQGQPNATTNKLACNGISCIGSLADVKNYMEYTDPDFQDHYSEGQITRMGAALNMYRLCLVTPDCTPPIANFTIPSNIKVGTPVTFTDASTKNPNAWYWSFSGTDISSSVEQNPTVNYLKGGWQTVSLNVSNEVGSASTSNFFYVEWADKTPIPHFEASDSLICKGKTVQFMNQTENTYSNTTYYWVFEGGDPSISTDMNPTVYYPSAGKYDVSLTATTGTVSSTFSKNDYIVFYRNCTELDKFEATKGKVVSLSGGGTTVELKENENLQSFSLYPNPSLDLVNIEYHLNENSFVEVNIYNLLGEKIQTVTSVNQEVGSYNLQINNGTIHLSQGTYFLTLSLNGEVKERRQFIIMGR